MKNESFKCTCGRPKKKSKSMCHACYVEEKSFEKGNQKRLIRLLRRNEETRYEYDALGFEASELLGRKVKETA